MADSTSGVLQGFAIGVASVSALMSLSTALFGDWFKERFGFRDMARLTIDVENRLPFFSHAWFRNVSSLIDPASDVRPMQDDSVKVDVLRVLVRNNGYNPARNVSVWLTRLDVLTPTSSARPNENVMTLRWADTWRFVTDKSERTIGPSDTDINFPLIPSQSAKFCDVCIFYDLDGPEKIDRFERGRLYLAIHNMPSRTFSVGAGRYGLALQVVAENARAARMTLEIEFNPRDLDTPLRVVSDRPPPA